MEFNYKDFDSLHVLVKKQLSQKIIEYYNILGWQIIEEKDNKRFEDLVDLTFCRPHKIENKDELQLMQVYLENHLNKIFKLDKLKHSSSTAFGLFFGIVGLALLVIGILMITNVLSFLNLGFAIAFTSVGAIFLMLCGIFLPRLVKKEIIKFESSYKDLLKEIDIICQKASLLTGGKNGR